MRRALAALPLPLKVYSPTKKEKSKTGSMLLDGQNGALREQFQPIARKLSKWPRRLRKKHRMVGDWDEQESGNCSNNGKFAGWTMPRGVGLMQRN